jgi:DNA (cytosine-5)-methyltransferase 1
MTLTVTDMFCGAGGSSIGVTAAGASVRLAMNHWPVAIESHAANFPGIDHACVKIEAANPAWYPTTDVLIASPECDAHTYAGGKRRARQHPTLFDLSAEDRRKREAEARSRATMLDVPRWAAHHGYQAIIVENVLEIFDWILLEEWFAMMAKLGYIWRVCSFNSMFFGGHSTGPRPPQSRDRVYIVFTRKGNRGPDLDYHPRAWCPRCDADVDAVQVFNPNRTKGRYRQQYRYRCPACAAEALPYVAPAASIIDWSLPCPPIGERKRPLAKSTIARIRAYLERHGFDPALVQVTHTTRNGKTEVQVPRSALEPTRTQTSQPETALAWPFVDTARRNATGREVGLPLTAVAAEGNHHALVEPFIDTARANNLPRSAGLPLSALSSGNNHYLVFPERGYVVANFNPGWFRDADQLPLGAVTARDHHGLLVQVAGNTYQRPGSTCRIRTTAEAMRAATGTLQEALVVPVNGHVHDPGNTGQRVRSAAQPLPTQTADKGHALVRLPADFLLPYNRTGRGRPAVEPIGTQDTRDRYALVSPDGEIGQHLDKFIQACGYRMLVPAEIGAAMAFPGDYKVTGTRDEQVAQYGNAVTPPVMTWIFGQVVESLA